MSYAYLVVGIVLGAIVVTGGLIATGQQDIQPDAVCQERFGDNWTSENMDRNFQNQSVGLTCSNGTQTEEIAVSVNVEVDG